MKVAMSPDQVLKEMNNEPSRGQAGSLFDNVFPKTLVSGVHTCLLHQVHTSTRKKGFFHLGSVNPSQKKEKLNEKFSTNLNLTIKGDI